MFLVITGFPDIKAGCTLRNKWHEISFIKLVSSIISLVNVKFYDACINLMTLKQFHVTHDFWMKLM